MRAQDVKAGAVYDTKVGNDLMRVKVLYEASRQTWGDKLGPKRWKVARVDNNTALPKPRTAAALREVKP